MDRDNLRDAAFRVVLGELRDERDRLDKLIRVLEAVDTSDAGVRVQVDEFLQSPEIRAALRAS